MNRTHKVVWNEALSTWTAVSETARGRGKSASARLVGLGAVAAALLLSAGPALADCTGGGLVITCDAPVTQTSTVGAGAATPDGTTVIVQQGAVIDVVNRSGISTHDSSTINVSGTVQGNSVDGTSGGYGSLGGNTIEFDSKNILTVQTGGKVLSTGAQESSEAINVVGTDNTVINNGLISTTTSPSTIYLEENTGKFTVVNNAGGIFSARGGTGLIVGTGGNSKIAIDFTNKGKLDGQLVFGGGDDALRWFTGASITNPATIDGGAGNNLLTLNGTGTDTFNHTITGFQTLEKQDSGSWTLGVALQSSGILATTVSGGTLILGADASDYTGSMNVGAAGTLQSSAQFAPLAITDNGLVRFAQPTDAPYTGVVSGTGGIEKTGAGRLTLTQDQAFTGTTTISAGALRLGNGGTTGAVLGDIVNNAALEIERSNALTLAGNISGSGSLLQGGSGTTTLTGSNSYSGTTSVAVGTLRAGAANTLSAASAHNVASGATLDLAGQSQTIGAMTNSGTVSLVGSAPGTTLTVNGPWVGNGGLVRLGTALGNSASATDRLVLNGPGAIASGNTRLQVTNLGGLGALTTGNGIALVSAVNGAVTAPSAFALVGGHVDAGAFEYRLFDGDATGAGESWYLRSTTNAPTPTPTPTPTSLAIPTYRAEVPLIAAVPAQLRQGNLAMLGNLHQRVGDDDLAPANPDSPRRAWARVVGADIDIRQTGQASPHSDGRLRGLQVGTDLFADGNWRAGLYVGRLEGDIDVSGFARGVTGRLGHNDLRSDYLGGYATYRNATGFYADTVIQAGRHRYTVEPLVNLPSSGKGSSALASVEVGQSFKVADRWTLEPQLQLIYQQLRLGDMGILGAQVQQRPDNGWMARAGLRLKGEYATAAGTLQPYARVNVYRASSGNDIARFVGPAGTTDIASSTGNTSAELAGGLTLTLNSSTSVYGEIGKLWAVGGDSRIKSGLQGSAGVRVRW